MPNAHERAQQEADEFLRRHPEFKEDVDRLESGESASREVPMPLKMGGQRVFLDPSFDTGTPWPPHVRPDHALGERIERAMMQLKEKYADLLRRVYWERQTQEDIGNDLGISQQAVSQRIKTAERKLKAVLVNEENGMEGDDEGN